MFDLFKSIFMLTFQTTRYRFGEIRNETTIFELILSNITRGHHSRTIANVPQKVLGAIGIASDESAP